MKKTAIILFAVLFGTMQAKAYELEVDGIYYNFKEGTTDEVVVTCFIDYWYDDFDGVGNYKGHIVIPETIIHEDKIYRVTGIDYFGFKEGEIESVIIPKSIKNIGLMAFRNLRGTLKRIEVQWQTLFELKELEIENNELWTDYEDIVLVVPKNTKTFYQEHDIWKKFIHIEESQ